MVQFNQEGELNAVTQKDAIEGLAKYAGILQNHVSANQNLAGKPSYSEQQKDDMIKRALMSADGKVALGQAINAVAPGF